MPCKCLGFTARDISMWCEVHATKENLTEEERVEMLAKLQKSLEHTQSRIDALK